MDLGCLDMERRSREFSSDNESSPSSSNSSESLMATYKIGKNKGKKGADQSILSTLNKCTSQIRKPPRRKTSPLNWFPRKKVDSYLKRKIQLLQQVDGMNSTLDETLGDSNLHYSKVLKEKIAVREAAAKAMEARKAAMVEASWCKILHAARIECKDAEARLLEAEKSASDAFEAATSIGVIMYDIADCPRKYYRIETSAAKEEGGPTHAVSASFESAFEVDRQVACAVKVAFTKLANCSSINKDEFRELLRKISQNPDSDEIFQEFTSECESDTGGAEIETGLNDKKVQQMRLLPSQASEKFNTSNLVEMMLEKLKDLHEDELASLATIVATCGLNAALAERGLLGSSSTDDGQAKRGVGVAAEIQLPSLDKFLVKRLTRLERDVLEAKNAQKNEAKDENQPKLDKSELPSLDKFLVKKLTRLEKEVLEAKNALKNDKEREITGARRKNGGDKLVKRGVNPEAGLDKVLSKHVVSRLEKEVLLEAAKKGRIHEGGESVLKTKKFISAGPDDAAPLGKENIDQNKSGDGEVHMKKIIGLGQEENETTELLLLSGEAIPKEAGGGGHGSIRCGSLDQPEDDKMNHHHLLLTRREAREKEVQEAWGGLSLGNSIRPHISKLQRDKISSGGDQIIRHSSVRKEAREKELQEAWGGLSLGNSVKPHVSKLERHKKKMMMSSEDQIIRPHKEAREKELQDSWGGLSLGNSIRPHLSRLEREKAAWLKAEEEERRKATNQNPISTENSPKNQWSLV